jgi:hypothetical protein
VVSEPLFFKVNTRSLVFAAMVFDPCGVQVPFATAVAVAASSETQTAPPSAIAQTLFIGAS